MAIKNGDKTWYTENGSIGEDPKLLLVRVGNRIIYKCKITKQSFQSPKLLELRSEVPWKRGGSGEKAFRDICIDTYFYILRWFLSKPKLVDGGYSLCISAGNRMDPYLFRIRAKPSSEKALAVGLSFPEGWSLEWLDSVRIRDPHAMRTWVSGDKKALMEECMLFVIESLGKAIDLVER